MWVQQRVLQQFKRFWYRSALRTYLRASGGHTDSARRERDMSLLPFFVALEARRWRDEKVRMRGGNLRLRL